MNALLIFKVKNFLRVLLLVGKLILGKTSMHCTIDLISSDPPLKRYISNLQYSLNIYLDQNADDKIVFLFKT